MAVSWCPSAAIVALVVTGFAASFSPTNAYGWDDETDLDRYVQSDDGYFSWEEITSYNVYEGVTIYILNMTSQKWQDETFSDRPIWWHIMGIAIPDQIDYLDFGVLWISHGGNFDDVIPPVDDPSNIVASRFANESKVVFGYIKQVPNQPTIFANDPNQYTRFDDHFISWTWREYLDSPNPNNTILARMPMTKAVKRGLDTIHQLAQSKVPESDIQRFAAAGPSERGWTAWSLAATDQRVVILTSLIFGLINIQEVLMHHFQSMDGDWSFALWAYYSDNLTQEISNPKAQGIYDIEDMYRYRERFTIPILQISASGDELYLCDENVFWWDGFPSTNQFLLMLPNAEHNMEPHYPKPYQTFLSVLLTFLQEIPFPEVWWEMNPTSTGGETIFHTNPPPVELFAYKAVTLQNDTRRDFRLLSGPYVDVVRHPVPWRRDIDIEDLGGGNYRIATDEVPGEWVGFFIEGQWEGPSGDRMCFTSQVHVIPNTYPHEACTDAASCYGTLV
jgi:PhoPQ-activated pathogenicity-related protein